jgi:hypothetical protein
MRTNTIKAIPLAFFGGIASATINIPFMVNEIRIICLTASIPADGVTRQLIITSNLLPNIDNPVGYIIDSMSLGVEFETTSSQSRLDYLFPIARPVGGSYTFTCLDFSNTFSPLSFQANVFIEFIQN